MTEIRTKIPNAKSGIDYVQSVGYRRYICGVDLGNLQDPTAMSIIEDLLVPAPHWGKGYVQNFEPRQMTVVQAFRLKIGMQWPDIVTTIKKVKDQIPDSTLWVDTSGIGQPVGAMLKEKGVAFTGVTITAGDRFSKKDHVTYHCSKSYLISYLSTLFQSGELRIAEGIKDAKALRQEIEDFQAMTTPSGNTSFGTREGRHDDLIISTCLAAFGCAQSQNSTFKMSSLQWG